MKIRSATFFHEPRSGKESGKETVFSLSAMLAKNKGQPQSKGLSFIHKSFLSVPWGLDSPGWRLILVYSCGMMPTCGFSGELKF